MRFVIRVICFQLLLVSIAQGQALRYPQIVCGNSFFPAHPAVKMLVRPVAQVDSFTHEMRIDGVVLGKLKYPRWQFEVLQAVEGFAPKIFEATIGEGQDSLFTEKELLLEMGSVTGVLLANLSLPQEMRIDYKSHIKRVHGSETSVFAKVLSIEPRVEEVSLASLGVHLQLPDSLDFGYDTVSIEDHYYAITFHGEQGEFVAFSRANSHTNGEPTYEEGEEYLMRLEEFSGALWISKEHLYRRGYHLEAYFEAYETLD